MSLWEKEMRIPGQQEWTEWMIRDLLHYKTYIHLFFRATSCFIKINVFNILIYYMLLSMSPTLTFMADLCCVEYVCLGLRHIDSFYWVKPNTEYLQC
jgi:hypothetical protein